MANKNNTNVIHKVLARACDKASHSWEYGATAQALLEFHTPELCVFGPDPFPEGCLPEIDEHKVPGLIYAKRFIETDERILIDGDGTLML